MSQEIIVVSDLIVKCLWMVKPHLLYWHLPSRNILFNSEYIQFKATIIDYSMRTSSLHRNLFTGQNFLIRLENVVEVE